jgi:hypothetical protein
MKLAKFIEINIVRKAQFANVSTHLLKWVFFINVHHHCDGKTHQTDEPPDEFQVTLTEFPSFFVEPTYANSQKGRQADFRIKTDPNHKIPFHSPYHISPHKDKARRRNLHKAMGCSWIQPSRSNFGSPVLFWPNPDTTLGVCIDYRPENAITVMDGYPLRHNKDLLSSIHGSCWFTKLDLVAGYHQNCIPTANRAKPAFTTEYCLCGWRVLSFGLANAPSQ